MQETLVKAWDKQESFQPGTNLKAWLFTILRNEFYSQMRKRGREVQDSDGALTARLAIHPAQHGQLDLEDFRKALQLLPEDQREAIILIGASGFSYEEAAEICGCAVGTIKSRVSRARTRLQEIARYFRRGRLWAGCHCDAGDGVVGELTARSQDAVRGGRRRQRSPRRDRLPHRVCRSPYDPGKCAGDLIVGEDPR